MKNDLPRDFADFWYYIGYHTWVPGEDGVRNDRGSGVPSWYRTPVREQTLLDMAGERAPVEEPAVEAWKFILGCGGITAIVLLVVLTASLAGSLPVGDTRELMLYARSPAEHLDWSVCAILGFFYVITRNRGIAHLVLRRGFIVSAAFLGAGFVIMAATLILRAPVYGFLGEAAALGASGIFLVRSFVRRAP